MMADLLPDQAVIRMALVAEGHRLLDLIDGPSRLRAAQVAGDVLGPRPAEAADLAAACHALYRQWKAWPLAAMLAHAPDALGVHAARLDLLRAWSLCASLAAVEEVGARHTTWQFAARAVRRLTALPGLDESRSRCPEISLADPARVQEAIEGWLRREREAGAAFAGPLEHVARAVAQLAGRPRRPGGAGIRRSPAQSRHVAREFLRAPAAPSPLRQTTVELSFEEFDFEAEDLLDPEEEADVAQARWVRRPAGDPALSPEEQDAGAELEILEELFEATGVTTVSGHLTQAEARRIVQALRRDLARGPEAPGVALLAASLLTGRTVAELAALPHRPGRPGESWWHLPDPLGLAHAPAVPRAPQPPAGGFVIGMPGWLQAPLRQALAVAGTSAADLEAAHWLKRQDGGGRAPRRSRIERALPAALNQAGMDSALVGLLAGADIRSRPQIYYARVACGQLDEVHRWYRQVWLGLPEADGGGIAPALAGSPLVGSQRVPDAAEVAVFFAERQAALDAAGARLARHDLGAAAEYHGAFVNAAAAILALCTGRRPHGLACPRFSRMQMVGPWPIIRIADKGNRLTDDARWLPVPGLLRETLAAIREQLGHVRDWGRLFDPTAARMAEEALEGRAEPLWYLPERGAPPESLAARAFWERVRAVGGHRNAFRHMWRTTFIRAGVPGWASDFWMGHGGWGSAQHLPSSGYCAADLEGLAAVLEREIGELGLAAPQARRLVR